MVQALHAIGMASLVALSFYVGWALVSDDPPRVRAPTAASAIPSLR